MDKLLDKLLDIRIDENQIDVALRYILDCDDSLELSISPSFHLLKELFQVFLRGSSSQKIYVIIEYDYVERMYRDTYYTYFAGKNQIIPRECKRLFIFTEDIQDKLVAAQVNTEELEKMFIGTITIRPLKRREIGRSLLNPSFLLKNVDEYKVQLATYRVNMFGVPLKIKAFPYSMQDGEMVTCAELTIQGIVDYYSTRYSNYHILLPSDITRIACEYGYERNLPSHGLSYDAVSKVFLESRFFPRLYRGGQCDVALKEILHCYIESGMVVAVGLRNSNKRGHSLICIGRGSIDPNMIVSELIPVNVGKDVKECYVADTSSGCTDYVVMDDNMVPYSQCKIETQKGCWNHRTKHYEENTFLSYSENDICKKYAIECIVVPMSKRMYLEAADAREIFRTVATDFEIGIKSWCDNIRNNFEGVDLSIIGTNIGNVSDDPIVMRVFLATSRSYKRNRREVFSNNTAIRDMYCSIAMPKYVWVCELYTKETLENNQVIGEIVVDATAAAHIGDKLDAILLLHYPHKIVSRDLHEKREDFLKKLRDEGDYYGWKPWNPFHFHSKVLFNVNN